MEVYRLVSRFATKRPLEEIATLVPRMRIPVSADRGRVARAPGSSRRRTCGAFSYAARYPCRHPQSDRGRCSLRDRHVEAAPLRGHTRCVSALRGAHVAHQDAAAVHHRKQHRRREDVSAALPWGPLQPKTATCHFGAGVNVRSQHRERRVRGRFWRSNRECR